MWLRRTLPWALPVVLVLVLAGCESTPPYVYRYVPGKTAVVAGDLAVAPPLAPAAVHQAVAAGNEIVGRPYRYGGGHRSFHDDGYDCSGAVSYVLYAIGRLSAPAPSDAFRRYGEGGAGRWITVYARRGHVFLVVAGLRFDTGYGTGASGARWLTRSRPADHYVMRHPRGL